MRRMEGMDASRAVWTTRGVLTTLTIGVGALGIGLTVWAVVSYWVMFHAATDHDRVADVRPLRRLIATILPVGSTVGQARIVLRSRAVTTFIARRGFDALAPATVFHRVPSFDGDLDESEVYAGGMVLFAETRNRGNGRLFSERQLIARLFFDADGRFTHCTVAESVTVLS